MLLFKLEACKISYRSKCPLFQAKMHNLTPLKIMSRGLYLRQIHILAESRACKIRYKTVHYIVQNRVLLVERFAISYQFFHAWRFAGKRSQRSHFTLNCIPTPLKIVSRGLNLRKIYILAEFRACKTRYKTVHYILNRIVILLERFAILYQFFHAWRLPLQKSKCGVQNQVQNCSLYSIWDSNTTREICNFVPVFSRLEVATPMVKMSSFQSKLPSNTLV